MKQTYSFDDVLLVPQHSDIESRKDICIASNLAAAIFFARPTSET